MIYEKLEEEITSSILPGLSKNLFLIPLPIGLQVTVESRKHASRLGHFILKKL